MKRKTVGSKNWKYKAISNKLVRKIEKIQKELQMKEDKKRAFKKKITFVYASDVLGGRLK